MEFLFDCRFVGVNVGDMARPRTNIAPDQFTTTEAAVVGARLPARAAAILQAKGLAPKPFSGTTGRSGVSFYSARGVAHWSLIGGLYWGGVPLLPSSRLAAPIADELGAAYGQIPSNLRSYLESPLNPTPGRYPWPNSPDDSVLGNDVSYDFWIHHFLRTRTNIYKPGIALRGDFCIEVVDREFVFSGFSWKGKLKVVSPFGGESSEMTPDYRIVGWKRGSNDVEVEVHHLIEELPRSWVDSDPEAMAKGRAVEAEFHAARENPVSVLRVNIGLAIRNAFDAIHDHRIKAGAKFNWTPPALPEPDRYAGCDDEGSPLDPEHPWNKDRPPVERAKRLVEIEEYIVKRDKRWAEQQKSKSQETTSDPA
jgi:hypothetical protein